MPPLFYCHWYLTYKALVFIFPHFRQALVPKWNICAPSKVYTFFYYYFQEILWDGLVGVMLQHPVYNLKMRTIIILQKIK